MRVEFRVRSVLNVKRKSDLRLLGGEEHAVEPAQTPRRRHSSSRFSPRGTVFVFFVCDEGGSSG